VERMYLSYYRLEPEYEKRPTLFEYEITVDSEPYRYGFEIMLSEDRIVGEWLYRISIDGDDELVFERVGDNITDSLLSKKEKDALSKKIKTHGGLLVLTLSDLFRDKKGYDTIDEITQILDWFQNKLVIIGVKGTLRSHYDYQQSELEKLGEVLRAFDVGISDIGFTEWIDDLWMNAGHEYGHREKTGSIIISDAATERKNKKKREILVSRQGKNKVEMLRIDESDGTNRLFDLAPILIKDDSDITYVVDELDRSLHPLVVFEFVKWFLEQEYSKPKQLIITTHQILLMDQELLRKDEIWFVEKKEDGHSELFSLDEYNERPDRKIDRSYLDGRYGAIPKIYLRKS